MNQENRYPKTSRIANDLRTRIVSGTYAVGDRLPTRDELTEAYGVSKVTVQRALAALAEQGFVEARGSAGTFVSTTSPHRTRYLLLFPVPSGSIAKNQYFNSLAQEAYAMGGEARFDFFYGFSGSSGLADYEEVLDAIATHRVAGIIFATAYTPYRNTPLVEQPGIPRTAMMSKQALPHIPVVSHDYTSFLVRSLQHLRTAGCTRPAFVVPPGMLKPQTPDLEALVTAHGMTWRSSFVQALAFQTLSWTQNLLDIIMDRPARDEPDGLIICNDNFVEPVTRGLKQLGLRSPDDLHLVAECNFPYPVPSHLPVTRIGFSVPECLQLLMRNIDLQTKGELPPGQTWLRAITEAEGGRLHTPKWVQPPKAAKSH